MEIKRIDGIDVTFVGKGIVRQTLINNSFDKTERKRLRPPSVPVDALHVIRNHGVLGDYHAGYLGIDTEKHGMRQSDIRELKSYALPRETEVFNAREYSAIAVEEGHKIQHELGLTRTIPYGALNENLVIEGIPDFSSLPPGTLLHFFSPEDERRDALLAVWNTNMPCPHPGKVLRHFFPEHADLPAKFNALKDKPVNLRGIVGFVFRTGVIYPGDTVYAQLPTAK